jgi:hypothetical protein
MLQELQKGIEMTRRPLSRKTGTRERGAALIEAAIVLPLILVLFAGIVEYGVAFHESGAIAAASRAGARTAAAMPKNVALAAAPADSASQQLQGVGADAPVAVWVFRVAASGAGPVGAFGNCTDCVGFPWSTATRRFDTASPLAGSNPWSPGAENACAGQSDEVGVAVVLQHTYLFGIFGKSRQLTHTTVMRLEPYVGALTCGPTP